MEPLQLLLDERQIRRVVDDLFRLTDLKAWDAGAALFVEGPIEVDVTSLAGGQPVTMRASELFAGFEKGLHAYKLSHHLATNVIVELAGDEAEAQAHGYSINVLNLPGEPSRIWETWGTYHLPLRRTEGGWKLAGFTYDSRHTRGDDEVRTHTLPE